MSTDRMPMISLPNRRATNAAPITLDRRLALIRRVFTDHRVPVRERVAGLLLMMYAQPVGRTIHLTVDESTVETSLPTGVTAPAALGMAALGRSATS